MLVVYFGLFHILSNPLIIAKERSSMQAERDLVVGMSVDYAPYAFYKKEKNHVERAGFDVEIAKLIAKRTKSRLVIHDLPFETLLNALESGRVDMIMGGISKTEERSKKIDFSHGYYRGGQAILVRKGDKKKYTTLHQLQHKKVGVQKGSIQEKLASDIKGARVTSLDKVPELILQLQTERVDAVILEHICATGYLGDSLSIAFTAFDETLADVAIGVKKNNPSLLHSINTTIDELIRSKQIDMLVEQAAKLAVNSMQTDKNLFQFFWDYRYEYLLGLSYTLLLAFLGVLFGVAIGLFFCFIRLSPIKAIRWMGTTYIELLRGTPMLVQLLIVHYGLSLTLGIHFTPLQSGIITLSINSSAYLAEIFRVGVQSVDRGQMEAAHSLGMSMLRTMQHIIVPQAFKTVLPAICNEFITIIKESSIISIIGMTDIMYQANVIRSITYDGFRPLVIAAALYFIITFVLSKFLGLLERKLSISDKR